MPSDLPFHHLGEFYADYGEYDVTLDVPEAFEVGATGPRISDTRAGNRRVVRHRQSDVHDFVFTAWDLFAKREEMVDGVRVEILFPRGYDAMAERELETVF